MGPGSHPRSRLAVPGQGWHRVQTLAAGPPAPAEAGRDTSASAEAGKAAVGTAFRGRPGGRMWNGGMISLTLPGIRCFSRHCFQGRPGAHWDTRALGGRVGCHCHSEGRRGAAGQAAADLLWRPDPPPNPEAALGRLHAGSGQPLLPTLLSPGAPGTNENLSPGLPGGRDAPAGSQCRPAQDEGLRSPLTPP